MKQTEDFQCSVPSEDEHPAMSPEEARAIFDRAAQRYLHMSGPDFLGKWRLGFFEGKPDLASRVDAVSILLPLIEQ